jgi:hypothetical protein
MSLPTDYRLVNGLYYKKSDDSGPYYVDEFGVGTPIGLAGTAGGDPVDVNLVGASGSVTINVNEADLAALGTQADAAATTDTGTFSIISLMKRGLQNWTTFLGRFPASLGSKTTANTIAVSIATDDVQIGTKVTASTALGAGGAGIIGWLSDVRDKIVLMSAKLPAALGITTAAGSISVAPASDANIARETYSTIAIFSVQTSATGANWVSIATASATQIDLVNNTGTTIEYRRGGAGTGFPLLDGNSRLIQGITNADQISVRRLDQSNTQVTLFGERFVV